MILAERVSFAYDGVAALAEVGLSAAPGQVVGLIGPNGSGKTTLLRTLYAALTPRAGLISVDDTPVASLSPREVALRLGVVVQEPSSGVPITGGEMVLLGRSPHRSALQRYTTADRRIAAAALQRVGARHLADRPYAALSGGEKQRVLIARTLAQQTDHLLADQRDPAVAGVRARRASAPDARLRAWRRLGARRARPVPAGLPRLRLLAGDRSRLSSPMG